MRLVALLCGVALLAVAVPAEAQDKEPEIITRLKAVKDLKGPFTLIVHVEVKKGEGKHMLEASAPCIAATRKEKGCIAYELHQDLEDPSKFVFFERWKSVKDLQDHLGADHTKKLLGEVVKILAGTPKFQVYRLSDEK